KTYTSFRRILGDLVDKPMWTVLLSTNGQIEVAARASQAEPSKRIAENEKRRPDPYFAFDTDIHETNNIKKNPPAELGKSLLQLAKVDHVIFFGRPLWKICEGWDYKVMGDLVRTKLIGGLAEFKPSDLNHAFAAISFRVCLEPSMNDSRSVNLAITAV